MLEASGQMGATQGSWITFALVGCEFNNKLLFPSVEPLSPDLWIRRDWTRCDPTPPPGPPAGHWPLPLSRRRREMKSNKEQRSAVFVILFALITILILYSSNSANEVFHYGSLQGRTRRPVNLRKWSLTDGYIPILGNKGKVPLVVEHRLVHHGDCSGVV
ncbi:alpha-N-acetylgalactosaminide alpha-2,6-sialyltransferase 6 isoform X3 [Cervus canadensis]|uniref:alpha-N-acetylgalactosaminide alpha-2,6-sialyltransferase 6 isoform X3 n=1 Tax=Cervus canadensis TaxID=1574408 RepID=UPI001C9E8A36|nr:alpha-N-acetylgalactosaminide alpha-2,6-sialyltransferase 6 isoform X3 [Cervus canadensis]